MNVIFLDLDGVINTYYYKTDKQTEEKIKILADICNEYNCKVVIAASSKDLINEDTMETNSERYKKIFNWFNKYGIDCIGRTPSVCKYYESGLYTPIWKEDEIRLYLFRHPEIEHYCVMDDDDLNAMYGYSDLNKVRLHLVKTELYLEKNRELEGLQTYHKEEVGKILKLENDMKKYALRRKENYSIF